MYGVVSVSFIASLIIVANGLVVEVNTSFNELVEILRKALICVFVLILNSKRILLLK